MEKGLKKPIIFLYKITPSSLEKMQKEIVERKER
ncbi:hypothetical protein CLMAG_55150 [Clostridium magnum DSM 2767]|uniref:Uncharacterized protein n=1 Tax=Clostridium magnum DSM 2767 TaxID=1121326 RepID=A0A161YGJ8_9CLOT|nr:hypothetical protein CLMAG_55150 [Clostridium magnum DSM 2767]